jgi:hypothetical protein
VGRRRIFQWLTVGLTALCIWTAYANVLSDDAEVRAKARSTANTAAGCGEDCKLDGLRGDRGMFDETIEYDLVKRGHYVVVCRRAYVFVGDYACTVTSSPTKS